MAIIYRISSILVLCVYLIPETIHSQDNKQTSVEEAYEFVKAHYGPDPVLINGKYFEDIYRNDLGHPFYPVDEFLPGTITVHGKLFENIGLKYNIYDQTVIVSFSDGKSPPIFFIPPTEFISGFSIKDEEFSKCDFQGENQGFYHNVFTDQLLSFFVIWSKKRYDSYHNKSYKAYKYSESRRKLYFSFGNSHFPLKKNRSFIKIFNKERQKEITEYLKSHQINLKKSNSEVLCELGAFCVNLLHESENE